MERVEWQAEGSEGDSSGVGPLPNHEKYRSKAEPTPVADASGTAPAKTLPKYKTQIPSPPYSPPCYKFAHTLPPAPATLEPLKASSPGLYSSRSSPRNYNQKHDASFPGQHKLPANWTKLTIPPRDDEESLHSEMEQILQDLSKFTPKSPEFVLARQQTANVSAEGRVGPRAKTHPAARPGTFGCAFAVPQRPQLRTAASFAYPFFPPQLQTAWTKAASVGTGGVATVEASAGVAEGWRTERRDAPVDSKRAPTGMTPLPPCKGRIIKDSAERARCGSGSFNWEWGRTRSSKTAPGNGDSVSSPGSPNTPKHTHKHAAAVAASSTPLASPPLGDCASPISNPAAQPSSSLYSHGTFRCCQHFGPPFAPWSYPPLACIPIAVRKPSYWKHMRYELRELTCFWRATVRHRDWRQMVSCACFKHAIDPVMLAAIRCFLFVTILVLEVFATISGVNALGWPHFLYFTNWNSFMVLLNFFNLSLASAYACWTFASPIQFERTVEIGFDHAQRAEEVAAGSVAVTAPPGVLAGATTAGARRECGSHAIAIHKLTNCKQCRSGVPQVETESRPDGRGGAEEVPCKTCAGGGIAGAIRRGPRVDAVRAPTQQQGGCQDALNATAPAILSGSGSDAIPVAHFGGEGTPGKAFAPGRGSRCVSLPTNLWQKCSTCALAGRTSRAFASTLQPLRSQPCPQSCGHGSSPGVGHAGLSEEPRLSCDSANTDAPPVESCRRQVPRGADGAGGCGVHKGPPGQAGYARRQKKKAESLSKLFKLPGFEELLNHPYFCVAGILLASPNGGQPGDRARPELPPPAGMAIAGRVGETGGSGDDAATAESSAIGFLGGAAPGLNSAYTKEPTPPWFIVLTWYLHSLQLVSSLGVFVIFFSLIRAEGLNFPEDWVAVWKHTAIILITLLHSALLSRLPCPPKHMVFTSLLFVAYVALQVLVYVLQLPNGQGAVGLTYQVFYLKHPCMCACVLLLISVCIVVLHLLVWTVSRGRSLAVDPPPDVCLSAYQVQKTSGMLQKCPHNQLELAQLPGTMHGLPMALPVANTRVQQQPQ